MKVKCLFALGALMLVVASFLIVPSRAVQPPIDTSTYWVGTIGQPRRVDPARAYDTASAEYIMNVYETLVGFKDKPLPDYSKNSIDLSNLYADLSKFEGILAETWWFETRADGGVSLCFKIKTGIPFQPWIAANGSLICEFMDIYDVEYTFKRMLVQDMMGAPSWMIALPFTGYMFFDEFDENPKTNAIEPIGVDGQGERAVRDLINSAIEVVNETVIRFNMLPGKTWPEVALLQIFAESWGCIVSKDFSIEHGCWDGSFADGWSSKYRRKPSNTYSPLDRYYEGYSKYPSTDPDVPAMCGTGPYISRKPGTKNVADWDTATLTWKARAWENLETLGGKPVPDSHKTYRGGWNPPGVGPRSIRNIVVQGVPEWPTRKMMFLKGDFDSIAVPRANMWDLLKEGQQFEPLAGIRLYYNAPLLSNDVMVYCFTVDPNSMYVPKVGGAPKPDLFKDIHMRKAFNYALNFTMYIKDAWFGEAIQQASWWVEGLQPPQAKNTSLVPYNINLDLCEQELRAAGVWTTGFEVTIFYNLGNDQRKIAAEMIRDAIHSLNARRPGLPAFKVEVKGADWPVILEMMELFEMPIYFIGWLADFAHPDNFARPYMHSHGDFAYFQNYSDPYVDQLIDAAIVETNITRQCEMYQELQYIYWRDAISLPVVQALGRRWERDWVRGWYYNQLYPGLIFYELWKTVEAPPSPCDLSAVGSVMNVTQYLINDHGKPDVEICYPYGTKQEPVFDISLTVHRADSYTYAVPIVVTVVYIDKNGYVVAIDAYPDILIAGGSAEYLFTLDNPSLDVSTVKNPYNVEGQVWVFASNFYDENLTNNRDYGGYFSAVWLLGDINCDRIVEMMDFFYCSQAFMSFPGHPRWDPRCDLYGEKGPATSPAYAGDGIVEMMDFYVLSIQFMKSI